MGSGTAGGLGANGGGDGSNLVGVKALEDLARGAPKRSTFSLDLSGPTRALKRFARRSGGASTAAGAMLLGGVATMATLREVPRLPATCLGTALAGYAVQLPKGNRVGDSTREVGRQVAYLWDSLASAGEEGQCCLPGKRRR
mmetsp:Transcript_48324/g.90457  ORF Transcript_48324/g.90457 Transcript_48324/m.90457 type:complete len:142 (-) Transcript_48324:221-646(-)